MKPFMVSAMLLGTGDISIGSGRLIPSVAAAVGLAGVVLGCLALTSRTGSKRIWPIAANAAGLTSAVVGGLHATYSAGGVGTGNGLAGAIVAIVLGLISMVLGGLAMTRPQSVKRARSLNAREDDPDLKRVSGIAEK